MKLLLSLSALVVSLNATIILPLNFETSFHQTITNDKGSVIKYEGTVLFKNMKEGVNRSVFKWNYVAPTQKEVCTDGIQVVVVDHDLEQVSNYLVEEGINLESIINVAEKITNKDYKATYKEIEYLITLNDKEELTKIVYVDNLENGVKIIFDNMQYNNPSFDVKKLECLSPKEYDVIGG